jgi:hypothetical protein
MASYTTPSAFCRHIAAVQGGRQTGCTHIEDGWHTVGVISLGWSYAYFSVAPIQIWSKLLTSPDAGAVFGLGLFGPIAPVSSVILTDRVKQPAATEACASGRNLHHHEMRPGIAVHVLKHEFTDRLKVAGGLVFTQCKRGYFRPFSLLIQLQSCNSAITDASVTTH